MKRDFGKSLGLMFSVMLILLLSACQNPFLVGATKLYKATFETNCDTKIDSYRASKIESEPKVTKTDYVFDGWYTSASFEGNPITFPYELMEDTTFYVLWREKCEIQYESSYAIPPVDIIIGKGKTITSEQLPELTSNDYFFDGWYINDVRIEAENYVVNGTITLTAKWLEKCKISYESAQGATPVSIPFGIGKKITSTQLPELTSDGYTFDGWYIGDERIVANEYEVPSDITLTAKWSKVLKTFTFEAAEITISSDYVSGVLTLKSDYNQFIFKGDSSTIFSNLRIKPSSANQTLVFDNFSFSSPNDKPLIESAFDISIEYRGTNKLSSTSSSAISLIYSSGTIEITGNEKSSLELQPNTVTDSKEQDGSIGIEANEVTINGGNIEIRKSDGWNNSTSGRNGGSGSTGIKADVVIKNNAVVTITGGNGANGNTGSDGRKGNPGAKRQNTWEHAGDGEDGHPGYKGGNGGKGGTAIYGNLDVGSGCNVSLTGGKGGNGGQGGRGGKGGTGGGNSAAFGSVGNGGDGGTGGQGGNGGDGGDAIFGELKSDIITINMTKGTGGLRGEGGYGGYGGDIGKREDLGSTGNPHSGNDGSPGEPGLPGEDGVEHR